MITTNWWNNEEVSFWTEQQNIKQFLILCLGNSSLNLFFSQMISLVILQSSLLFCINVLITSHIFTCCVTACSDLQIFISKLDFLPIRIHIWVPDMCLVISLIDSSGCTTGTSNPTSTTYISHCLSACIISIFHPIQLFFCSLNWLLILLFTQSPELQVQHSFLTPL